MTAPKAIFLSASVPDPERGPQYAITADSVAITAAVSALLYVTLGRRYLVWGGHPAITPIVWAMAEDLGVEYSSWVKLYQTAFFQDQYPEDNVRFQNVVYTQIINNDRESSLLQMRSQMFRENAYEAAVFIGGMKGVVDEFQLFRSLQPNAKALPVLSTGGAVLDLAKSVGADDSDLMSDLDYVGLFHRKLGISAKEKRTLFPADKPSPFEMLAAGLNLKSSSAA